MRRALPLALVALVALVVASCMPSFRLVPSTAAGVMQPSASIDSTGSADVTAELQRFLDSVPHNTRIAFPAGARYRIEGTLTIKNKNDIIVDGNGALFFATQPNDGRPDPRERRHWQFENISGLVIQNLTIRGAHPNGGVNGDYVEQYEAQHGINILGGESIEVRNVTVTDVYGDFVYIGRSARPVFGVPTNVWIHDNHFRRNGRQGVAVTTGFDVVIERNDIADTRRATFDLETVGGAARNIWIRNNRIGPGRLNFVAGHGDGELSHVYIEDNVLDGHTMGMDFRAPDGMRRTNVVVRGNRSNALAGNPQAVVMRFVYYDHVYVANNVQPTDSRDMYTVGSYDSCRVTAHDNDLGPSEVAEVLVMSNRYDCSRVPPLSTPERPVVFADRIAIDSGGTGGSGGDPVACPNLDDCGGMLVKGQVSQLTSAPLLNLSRPDIGYRTMLHGPQAYEIPIRNGTYQVTLSFVEPVVTSSGARLFHLDIELQRRESSFDVFKRAGGANRLLTRGYVVTVGDGKLDIDLVRGSTTDAGPIVSVIEVVRL